MRSPATIPAASAAAIVAAALAPGLVLLIASGGSREGFGAVLILFIFAAPLAALHLLFLGLPLYLYQDRHGGVGWVRAAFTGFLVGAVPIPLLILFLHGQIAWGGVLGPGLFLGGAGLAGGLAFRAIFGPGEAAE